MPVILSSSEIENEPSVNLYSTEVRDIISARPNWIVRNGITLFFVILVTVFASTFFVEYPDIVTANARLVSVNPPVELKTKVAGKLVKLVAKERDSVKAGDIIGIMESVADANKITLLYNEMLQKRKLMTKGETLQAINVFENKNFNEGLGEIQNDFNNYLSAYHLFTQYLASGFYLKKKGMLASDISYLQKLHSNLLVQKNMQQEDVLLAEKNFNVNASLSKDKVISDLDYRNERSKFIGKSLSLPQMNASIISNEVAVHEKRKEILQLENEIAQQKDIYLQSLNGFIAVLEQWQDKYLVKAPVSGHIVFADFIQENQYCQQGETICMVNSANASVYAQVLIPQNNFGKVDSGQQVLLKLPAYPHQEFGALKGRLHFISQVPTDSGFTAKIILPKGLLTNQQKLLQYRENLKAQAEIITSDRKLSDRFLSSLRSVFDRN